MTVEWTQRVPRPEAPPPEREDATVAGLPVSVERHSSGSITAIIYGRVSGIETLAIRHFWTGDLAPAREWATTAAGSLSAAGWVAR